MRARSLYQLAVVVLMGLGASATTLRAQPQPPSRQPDEQLAREMVFELAVSYDFKTAGQAIQPGFLVDIGGVGVTSYNSLHTAKSAVARFREDAEAYGVEILAANPSLDVALIKLTPQHNGAAGLSRFLTLGVGEIRPQQPVWTLKSSPSLDRSRAEPGLADVQRQGSGPGAWGRRLPFEAPTWLRANGKQDRRTPGCPLVDERCRLVGISIWAWPDEGAPPIALTASTVDDLLNNYREEVARANAKGDPAPTIAISQARSKFHDQRLAGSIFPRLIWSDPETTGPQAAGAANSFVAGVQCPVCHGTGKITRKVKVGTRAVGRAMFEDVFKDEQVVCADCKGCKLGEEKQLWAVASRVAQTFAGLRPGDERNSAALEHLAAAIDQIGGSGGAEFAKRINLAARDHLDVKKLHRGEPVMFVGRLVADQALQSWGEDVERAQVDGEGDASLLIVAPERYRLDRGERAVFVGVVSGFVTSEQNRNQLVLEHVSAVPFSTASR